MARFYTLTHAMIISGISEKEIVAAGERQAFPYQPLTKLIIDIEGFNRWVERRRTEQLEVVIEEIRRSLRAQTLMLSRVLVSMKRIGL